MSTVFSPQKARVTPAPAKRSEPKLRVVYGAPFRPPRLPFVIFVLSLLAAGLVGLLLLNTELQGGTFDVTRLNNQADQLRDQQEQLEKQVRTLESPQNVADRALRMGMVPNPNPVFLRLSDGRVLGVPAEGKAGTGTAMFGPDTATGTATEPPVTPVKPPAGTVKPPVGTVNPPARTVKPAGTVKPPAGTTNLPTGTTSPPAGTTNLPIGTTSPPAGTTKPRAGTTKPPAGTTKPHKPRVGTTGAQGTTTTGG
jgi:cell division protein FtsB